MIDRTLAAAILSAAALAPASGLAETYAVDPSHTSVIFGIGHLGMSYTYGRFNTPSGEYTLDRANPAASSFAFSIETASVDTNNAKRDEHLRGPDFFDAKQFPEITFRSTAVSKTERGYAVTGDLTLHGVTKEVTLPMRLVGEGDSPFGDYRTGFAASFKIKRSDFGMTNMVGPVGDNVAMTVSFEGVRQAP